MSACTATPVTDVTLEDIKDLLALAKDRPLDDSERERIWEMAVSYFAVLTELEDKKTSIKSLRELVFGRKTETKENVLGKDAESSEAADPTKEEKDTSAASEPAKPRSKGHGRNSVQDYTGAVTVSVPHESLSPGDQCPGGCGGFAARQK